MNDRAFADSKRIGKDDYDAVGPSSSAPAGPTAGTGSADNVVLYVGNLDYCTYISVSVKELRIVLQEMAYF